MNHIDLITDILIIFFLPFIHQFHPVEIICKLNHPGQIQIKNHLLKNFETLDPNIFSVHFVLKSVLQNPKLLYYRYYNYYS